MMKLTNLGKHVTNLDKAVKTIIDTEKFFIAPIVSKLNKAAEEYPSDPTIIGMKNFLSERVKTKAFITRGELKDVYNGLHSFNNKCAQYLQTELGEKEVSEVVKTNRVDLEGFEINSNAAVNHTLLNAFNAAFDGKDSSVNMYDPKIAEKAEQYCMTELAKSDMAPNKIKTIAGSEGLLICQATYDTPNGIGNIYLPVKVVNNIILPPNHFVLASGDVVKLDREVVKNHLLAVAGKSEIFDSKKIINKYASDKLPSRELNDTELVLLKVAAKKSSGLGPEGYVGHKVDEYREPVKVKVSEDLVEQFSEKLSRPAGVAEFIHSRGAINSSNSLLRKSLKDFGYNNSKIAIKDVSRESITFAVSLDGGAGFSVPVKFEDTVPKMPKHIIANGAVYAFSKDGVSKALTENDFNSSVITSSQHGLAAEDLIKNVKKGIENNNLTLIEDSLSVLAATDKTAYTYAFSYYNRFLNSGGLEKTASNNTSQCALQVKKSYSNHMICGHTNLPVHQVYQDKYGDCHPKRWQERENTAQGDMTNSLNYKLFVNKGSV